jgi:hypothetical protein
MSSVIELIIASSEHNTNVLDLDAQHLIRS